MHRSPLVVVVLIAGCAGPVPAPPTPGPPSTAAPSSPSATAPLTPTPAATRQPRQTPRPTRLSDREQARLDRELIAAAWANDVSLARRLIAAGADVNATDATVQSAYLISTSEGYLELLEVTLDAGADVDAKDSYNGTGLIRAADRGHADIAGRLVRAGIEVDHVNRLGWTALHEAIILGDGSPRYVDTVRVLVAAGADLQLPSRREGLSPLRHAEIRRLSAIAAVLRAALDDEPGTSAGADRRLLAAARRGDADAVAIELRAGADPATRDAQGRTPRRLAELDNHRAVARLLAYLGSA